MIDFLVIGGGIAGVSAAARLSRLGSTVLIEAEESLSYHASGRSAALFEPTYGQPSTVALNKASRDFHDKAEVLSPRGLLLIGNKNNAEAFATDQTQMKLDPITVEEAQQLVPIVNTAKTDRAAYHTDAWDINTDKLLQHFAKEARENGCQITTNSQATQITRIKTGWEVNTNRTFYFARTIVNAAGAWADEVAKMAGMTPLGFRPLRRSMARMPAPGGHDVSHWPVLFGPGESWYAKPDAGALIVSPAEEDQIAPQDAYADDLTLAEGLMRYEQEVTEPVVRLLSTWAGLRTFAPDRTLVLGPDATDGTFIWCAGQGGYGMQSAPAASQLLFDLVTGRQPAIDKTDVAALSPARLVKGAA